MTSHTETFARFLTEQPAEAVPPAARQVAREALQDTLGVALAGTVEPLAGIVREWLREAGAGDRATVLDGSRSTLFEAGFANGIFAHAIDYDDSIPSLRGHPSATIVPALLAAAEQPHAAGGDWEAAYVMGVEAAGKLGRVLGHGHYLRGWHSTATVGVFAAAAAVARLWRLDARQLCAAWGIAASQSGGLVRNFGTMAKPMQVGNAVRGGLLAADLARRGFTACMDILDGENGFVDVYAGPDGADPAERLARLGAPWEVLDPGIYTKGWPCCYCNHRPVGGIFRLMERHRIDPAAIRAIRIGFPPGSDKALIRRLPTTGLEGKFSIEYVAALAVLDGTIVGSSFDDAGLRRADLQAMMARIHRYDIDDAGIYSGIEGYNDVRIDTADSVFETRIDTVPGSPQWPLTDETRRAKFLSCATPALGPERARRLLDSAAACRTVEDLRRMLAGLVRQPADAPA